MTPGPIDQGWLVELTLALCRIPSPLEAERQLALFLAERLEEMGFAVDLQEVANGRPNVIAVSRGTAGFQSCLLGGHLDMAMPFGRWRRDPFSPWVEDGVVHGAGVQDMKAGLAAMAGGAGSAAAIPPDARGDVVFAAFMHHDTSSLGARYFLGAYERPLDAAMIAEPTDLALQLFHGGAWVWEIETRGVPRHQTRLEEGVSAVAGMAEVIRRLDPSVLTHTPDPRHPYLPRLVVGTVSGGEHTSITPERCVATGDVRFLPGMAVEGMERDLRRVADEVARSLPGLRARVRTLRHQVPYELDPGHPLAGAVRRAHARAHGSPPDEVAGGSPPHLGARITDAAELARHGIPTVLYGPGLWSPEPDEGVAAGDIAAAAAVAAGVCAEMVTRPR